MLKANSSYHMPQKSFSSSYKRLFLEGEGEGEGKDKLKDHVLSLKH